MAAESLLSLPPTELLLRNLKSSGTSVSHLESVLHTQYPIIASQHSCNMLPQFKGKENEAQRDLKVLSEAMLLKSTRAKL